MGVGAEATTPILSAALGLPMRPVRGYVGTAEIRQVIDSGEIDGTCLNKVALEAVFVPRENYAALIQGGTNVSDGLEGVPRGAHSHRRL